MTRLQARPAVHWMISPHQRISTVTQEWLRATFQVPFLLTGGLPQRSRAAASGWKITARSRVRNGWRKRGG
jgi:hypothetical protein